MNMRRYVSSSNSAICPLPTRAWRMAAHGAAEEVDDRQLEAGIRPPCMRPRAAELGGDANGKTQTTTDDRPPTTDRGHIRHGRSLAGRWSVVGRRCSIVLQHRLIHPQG